MELLIKILKGLLEEGSTASGIWGYSFAPKLTYIQNSKIAVKFEGKCLKQDKVSFDHKNLVNFVILYELDIWSRDLNTDFTVKIVYLELLSWLRMLIMIYILIFDKVFDLIQKT